MADSNTQDKVRACMSAAQEARLQAEEDILHKKAKQSQVDECLKAAREAREAAETEEARKRAADCIKAASDARAEAEKQRLSEEEFRRKVEGCMKSAREARQKVLDEEFLRKAELCRRQAEALRRNAAKERLKAEQERNRRKEMEEERRRQEAYRRASEEKARRMAEEELRRQARERQRREEERAQREAKEKCRRQEEERRHRKQQERARREEERRRAEQEQRERENRQRNFADGSIDQAFSVFELPETATYDEVRSRRVFMLKFYHPDHHGADNATNAYATEKTKKINEAFEVLKRYFESNPSRSSSIRWDEILCFDTETTGLGNDAEILQLSIVDGTGRILYDHKFDTRHTMSWDEAARIHGIWPSDVEDEPYFTDCTDEIERIFSQAKLIIAYNLPFDERMCQMNGLSFPSAPRLDVMVPFAKVFGEYSQNHRNYKWQKLVTAAEYYDVKLPSGMTWHDSTADCIATVGVFKAMIRDGHFPDIKIS